MIVKLCKKCRGSKWKLASVKPMKFVRCNKCQGRGGRCVKTEARHE